MTQQPLIPVIAAPPVTEAERKNGWTAESLAAYREERERSKGLVGGFVITEFPSELRARRKPMPVHQHAGYKGGAWSPLTRRLRK